MKLLYLAKSCLNNRYRSLFKSLGAEVIQYKNPLKAMDNIPEIEPDILYIVKDDYPRFWKLILSSLRGNSPTANSLYIIEGELDEEEKKAFDYLKGTLVLEDNSSLNPIVEKILEINKRSIFNKVVYPNNGEVCLGFVKSDDFSFITGTVTEISEEELIFIPENAEDIRDFKTDDIIQNASLSHNETVINLDLTVKEVSDSLFCIIKEKSVEYLDLVNLLFV